MSGHVDICELVTGYPLDRVVVFDTETTGTNPWDDEILSIGICDGRGNQLFSSYVRPVRHRSWPEAERINGISPSSVIGSPKLSEIAPTIERLLSDDKLVVGYNTDFDIRFLVNGGALSDWPNDTFDVMREYATVHGTRKSKYGDGYKWSKLIHCAAGYGYTFSAHSSSDDAIATAHCFRALLCDEAYLKGFLSEKLDGLKEFRVTQTKATKEAIAAIVGESEATEEKAELRLGAITRGKNKGTPRYECFVSDSCVGVSSPDEVDKIRMLYCLSPEEGSPKKVPCRASLYCTDDYVNCEVSITARGKLRDAVFSSAKQERELEGFEYRTIPAEVRKKIEADSRPNTQVNNIPNGDATSSSAKGCATGCTVFIVAVIIVTIWGVLNWFTGLFS